MSAGYGSLSSHEWSTVERILRKVVGTFYEQDVVVVMSYLLQQREEKVNEDNIARALQMQKTTVRKLLQILYKDLLVLTEERQEENRKMKSSFWYINLKIALDAIRYRLYLFKKSLEPNLRRSRRTAVVYQCANPRCLRKFEELDFQELLDMDTGVMRCTRCRNVCHEVQQAPEAQTVQQILDQKALEKVHQPLLDLLNPAQTFVMPDVSTYRMSVDLTNRAAGVGGTGATRKSSGQRGGDVEVDIESSEHDSRGMELTRRYETPPWLISKADKQEAERRRRIEQSRVEVTVAQLVSLQQDASREKDLYFRQLAKLVAHSIHVDKLSAQAIAAIKEQQENGAAQRRDSPSDMEIDNEVEEWSDILQDDPGSIAVTVQGKSVTLGSVTEALSSQMTSEEYSEYFELITSLLPSPLDPEDVIRDFLSVPP